MGDGVDAVTLEFFAQRLAVVDNQIGAQLTDPGLGLRARCATNHLERSQLAGQLRQD